MQWRIDYKRVSKSVAEINQPVAIVELTFDPSRKVRADRVVSANAHTQRYLYALSALPSLTPRSAQNVEGEKQIVRFELDKEKLRMLQSNVEAIQKRIHELAGTQP